METSTEMSVQFLQVIPLSVRTATGSPISASGAGVGELEAPAFICLPAGAWIFDALRHVGDS